jgi:hypothetical protein
MINLNLLPEKLTSSDDSSKGHLVNMSSNILTGQAEFLIYNQSENEVEANDAALLQSITQIQSEDTTKCEQEWNAPTNPNDPNQDNWIYQLEHETDSTKDTGITTKYNDANQQLNSRNTMRTSQTQMYQQIIGNFPQNQSLLWQTLSTGRGIVDTLSNLISSFIKG